MGHQSLDTTEIYLQVKKAKTHMNTAYLIRILENDSQNSSTIIKNRKSEHRNKA